jgi:hypothetical protein
MPEQAEVPIFRRYSGVARVLAHRLARHRPGLTPNCFIVRDANGQRIAYIYYVQRSRFLYWRVFGLAVAVGLGHCQMRRLEILSSIFPSFIAFIHHR